MTLIDASPVLRRVVTVTTVALLFLLVTAGLPVLVVTAFVVDRFRARRRGTSPVALRLLLFLWLYLLGELWALVALGGVGLMPRRRRVDLTFRLQERWAGWNYHAMRSLFRLSIHAEGLDQIPPAPILLLSRHASMVDTLLPSRFVVREHGIRLRYVVKRELLLDPVIDIGGNRLPNHFVDRGGASDREMAAVRALATDMGPGQGILIYSEGTRFSEEKRRRYVKPWVGRGGVVGEMASRFENVLPPRPGGTLALIESTVADVVVLAHRGLEGFARVADIWSGGLVGTRVDVRFWRIPRTQIPEARGERVEWLFRVWADVDAWVREKRFAE